ncbi:MAG: Crp/Fnr family transcriptional regulator [Nevskia sp.]|nr:Crp/Fnr family transcriptional regulator [Nevskia sp.]
METITALSHAPIRIRGVRGWPGDRGTEAPHLELAPAEKAELARLGEVVDFKTPGSLIFSQGDDAAFIHLLVDGLVRTYHTLQNGERQVVAFHWPGDLLGLAEDGRHVSSAQAIVPSRIYRFPTAKLARFLLKHPKVQDGFLVKAMHDLRAAQRQLIVMGKFDVTRRLAALLVDCSGHEHYFDPKSGVLTLPMSRDDVADYLGTSVETVIRAVTRLHREGLVERIRPRELKLDLDRLKGFAAL